MLRADDMRVAGIDIVPDPIPDSLGHCQIPYLRADNRESNEAYEQTSILASELTIRVEGPFFN